jgi:hypothetical protein
MKFKLEFTCDNAAFDGDDRAHEIARILLALARRIEGEGINTNADIPVRDINGNRIGRAILK